MHVWACPRVRTDAGACKSEKRTCAIMLHCMTLLVNGASLYGFVWIYDRLYCLMAAASYGTVRLGG